MVTAIISSVAIAYAIGLLLELVRPWVRWRFREPFALGCVLAGWLLHTIYLAYRFAVFYELSQAGSPLGIKQDWYYGAAWGLVLVYLVWIRIDPRRSFGVFFLPWVLVLIAVGYFLADPQPFARDAASRVWAAVHGASLLVATLAVLVAFAAGLMYLGQSYRLKHKISGRSAFSLPSLEWLRRTNGRAISFAVASLALGILSGVALNVIAVEDGSNRLPWHDPVVLATSGMFGWLVLSAGLGSFYKPAREGRKVAYLTVVSLIFLVIALGLVLSGATQHGKRRPPAATPRQSTGHRQSSPANRALPAAAVPLPGATTPATPEAAFQTESGLSSEWDFRRRTASV